MLKISLLILSILVLRAGCNAPYFFTDEDIVTQFQTRHLHNMTEHLCKDAYYKLRLANVIQLQYQDTPGYELGLVAAGIVEKYKHMIRVYRFYSNAKSFKDHNSTMQEILSGYSIIQSDYNEMVAETVLFYKTLDYHTSKNSVRREKAKAYAKKHKMKVSTVLKMMENGIKLEDMRRSIQTEPEQAFIKRLLAKDGGSKQELKKTGNENSWTKKNESNKADDEYKKRLRYIKWSEKWNGFNPEIEGVHVPDSVARVGLSNASNFLAKELKGDV